MDKYEVVKRLADDCTVEKIVYKMLSGSKNRMDAPDDLIQDIYIYLLEKDDSKIVDLYTRGELGYFILRMVRNQLISDHSYYYYQYIRLFNLSDGLEKAESFVSED